MDFYEPDYEALILDRQELIEAMEDDPESEYVVMHPLFGQMHDLLDLAED